MLGLGDLQSDGLPQVRDRKLRDKLKNGLAHFLSYFEHGDCLWFRKDGTTPGGVEFQWDGVRLAGLLVWEHRATAMGAKTFEERAKDADGFLKEYTDWANGHGYRYSIETPSGKVLDSCGGFLGDPDDMLDNIAAEIFNRSFTVTGDASNLEDTLRELVRSKRKEAVQAVKA